MNTSVGDGPERIVAAVSSDRTAAPDGITVGELVGHPELRTRIVAGNKGIERPVLWAHHTDNAAPWDWHDPGDLVLTSGAIVPVEPQDQVQFIERMAQAELCGLVVGEAPLSPGRTAPELSEQMIAAADRLGFPILVAEYSVPYVRMVRTVAAANAAEETRVLMQILRVHNEIHKSISNELSSAQLIDGLSRVLGFQFYVVDPERWEPLLPGCEVPGEEWREALLKQLDSRGWKVPHLIRADLCGRLSLVTPVPGKRSALVVVEGEFEATSMPGVAILQHIASACALEIARVDAEFERYRRWGADLLSAALSGRVDVTIFDASIEEHRVTGPWVCVALQADHAVIDRLVRRWTLHGYGYLLAGNEPAYTALLQANSATVSGLTALADADGSRVGISDPFSGVAALSDAARQARWALETVPLGTAGVGRYGDDGDGLLPRTLSESALVAERILGPLLAYDREHETDLVRTLQVYLETDRSPSTTAERMFLHKQTVSYRITRIQQLTQRSLRSSRDISELWFGLRALALSRTSN